ncbi:MAG: hypothetical protein IJ868_01775, partial [Prevotella sp.]|nr:hypothetical protein [Prevotella sp.]
IIFVAVLLVAIYIEAKDFLDGYPVAMEGGTRQRRALTAKLQKSFGFSALMSSFFCTFAPQY